MTWLCALLHNEDDCPEPCESQAVILAHAAYSIHLALQQAAYLHAQRVSCSVLTLHSAAQNAVSHLGAPVLCLLIWNSHP